MKRSSKIFGRSEPRTNYFNEWELLRKTLIFYRLNSIFDQDNFYTYKLICQWFKCSCRLCYLFLFVCLSVCLSVCLFIVYCLSVSLHIHCHCWFLLYSYVFCFSSCFLLFTRAWITILYYGVIRNFYLTVSVLFFLCACICFWVTVLTKWVAPPKMVYNWYMYSVCWSRNRL